MSSNKFHLNEARISRAAVDQFPVFIARGLQLSTRHTLMLQRKMSEALGVHTSFHRGTLAICAGEAFRPPDYRQFLADQGFSEGAQAVSIFGSQTFGMRKRLLSSIIRSSTENKTIIEAGLLKYCCYNPAGVLHSSLNVTVSEDTDYYRLFLEPGYCALYPLSTLQAADEMIQDYQMRVLEIPSANTVDGGFLGFMVDRGITEPINRGEFVLLDGTGAGREVFARLKRTKDSKLTYLVSERAVCIKPSYQLLVKRGDLRRLRDKTLIRADQRRGLVEDWFHKLFPQGSVSVADGPSAEISLVFDLAEPAIYTGQLEQKGHNLFYVENPLKFGPSQADNISIVDPYRGLRTYGPWDSRPQARPFAEVRPYIIYPDAPELRDRIYRFFRFFEQGGYDEGKKASGWDRSFRGFQREFRVPFRMPQIEDAVPNCCTEDEYLAAADRIIERWSASDGDASRIVIVVFPFDQEDDMGAMAWSTSLYPKLKQKFIQAGLPSQMIDRSTLEYLGVGRDGISYRNLYFGHVLWNLALNIYVKLGGRPWTLQRELDNVNCLIVFNDN